jgi:predicted RNase H-like HicB family nuclease
MTIKELVARMPLKVKKIDGKYLAYFPALREIKAEGKTEEEALNNARAVALKTLQSEIQEENVVTSFSDIAAMAAGPDASFWRRKTVAELARDQGVQQPNDLSEISGGWEDVDIDEFRDFIHELRGHNPHDGVPAPN